jgi:hypothetical protein
MSVSAMIPVRSLVSGAIASAGTAHRRSTLVLVHTTAFLIREELG